MLEYIDELHKLFAEELKEYYHPEIQIRFGAVSIILNRPTVLFEDINKIAEVLHRDKAVINFYKNTMTLYFPSEEYNV